MKETPTKQQDPSLNVRELINDAVQRLDDISEERDAKYQLQFASAKESVGIALIAQEKSVAAALDSTREAINKADISTDKRFDLLSEKIDGVVEAISKNTGSQGIYVTHDYLNNAFDKFRVDMESILKPIISKLSDVTVFMNSSQGRSNGLNQGWIFLLGGVSLISTIIAIFSFLSK